MPPARNKIDKNLQAIRENIAAAAARARRSADEVELIAVTKSADLEQIKALCELGVTQLGESRVPQLVERSAQLAAWLEKKQLPPARWHLIGHLQRNKVKAVLDAGVDILHSLDSLRLAEELDERAGKLGKRLDVLMEVNCSQEPQKFGVAVGAAVYLAEMITTLKNLRIVGLMTMAPLSDNPEDARPTFVRLRELLEEMQHDGIGGRELPHLSMGMSGDYQIAVEEGATMVRIGTAMFG